jgi:hypothetical protein
MGRERKTLENIVELDNEIAVLLFNHYSNMKMIKNDMGDVLDLLDAVAEGDRSKKELLRKKILDNYNDLTRANLALLDELYLKLKKE